MPVEQAASQVKTQTQDFLIPRHLGVTMDGNGRWAEARGLPRTEGHRVGIKALRRMVEYCIRYGVEYLTVFSFSSENWRRPKDEVDFIFKLLRRFVDSDLQELHEANVKIRILGSRDDLDNGLRKTISRVEEKTRNNTGLNLNVAFNYGGKSELTRAVKSMVQKCAAGELSPDDVNEDLIAQHLDTAGMPEPDVLLRTGGDQRLSNFMIWQGAYAELIFQNTYWPDFSEENFIDVLTQFSSRERRFGGLGKAVQT